ncbi:TRC40/GET3/ArsA family transport-energizing ATPase [bacterium]|nr:TRC40/GET3/ArsA family transport-energizing ATPase [bacterium]
MRVILFTGKGGVGKTTMSAATAVACARAGKRTIVLSTDAAHSLGDAFGVTIGGEPITIEKNLTALEVNVHLELKRNWGRIQKYISQFLLSQGYRDIVAEELAILPGMEDLFSLIKLLDLESGGKFDVAIIDCAPTGSTLQLLGLSDVLAWYMERFYDIEKKIALALKPVMERIIKAPMPDKEVYANIERIYERLMSVRELLADPKRSTVRLVTNAEKMVIQETQRAFTYLSLFGYPVDAVIANRLLPDAAKTGWFNEWARLQDKYMSQIRASFDPLPIFKAPLYPHEMIGPDALGRLAADVYGDTAADGILFADKPFTLAGEPGRYQMAIELPNVEKGDINLWSKHGELIISIGNFQRNFILPRTLADHHVTKAKLEKGVFHVTFERHE